MIYKTLNEINKYLQDTYKTDKIKLYYLINDKYFKYMILINNECVDKINDLDTYNINNSIYYYLTGEPELNDENELIEINKFNMCHKNII